MGKRGKKREGKMTEETRERGAERTKGRGGKGEERWEEKDREERKRMGVPSVLIFQFKHYLQDRFVAYWFEFLPRDAMHPRYQPWPCGRPSVRPSVRLSQVGVLLKRLNVGSQKQHHTIVQGL